MRRDDHARRSGARRAAHDGTEVARVGHLVETAEQRLLRRGELPSVRVGIRLAPGDDALVIRRRGGLGQLALALHVDARPLAEPVERLRGALARPQLEHLAPAAQRLTDGVAPVDELSGHARGTSR